MVNTLKSEPKFKEGDYVLISFYKFGVWKHNYVAKVRIVHNMFYPLYDVEFPDGYVCLYDEDKLKKISKKRYFLEAL